MTPLVHSVQLDRQGSATLYGSIDGSADELAGAVLEMKKRKGSDRYTFPLEWTGDTSWTAKADLTDIAVSSGTWDYYIVWHDAGRERLKTHEALVLGDDQAILMNQEQHTYAIQFYSTVKDSLSVKIATPSLTVAGLDGERISENTVRLTGYLPENSSHVTDLTEASLVVKREHAEDAVQTSPLYGSESAQHHAFYADISYQAIAHDDGDVKWDLYICTGGHLFRAELDSPGELERNTCLEWQGSELTLLYVYATVYHNLSIKQTGLKIKRDVASYAISHDTLHLQGYAYFEMLPFDRPAKLERSIIVRQRETGEELIYPLENLDLSENTDGHYPYAGFMTAIPLEAVQALQSDMSHVYDLSIRLAYGDTVREKGLGFESYQYRVDEPLTASTFWHRTKGVRSFLTLTPGGNIKLEMYVYARRKLKYLQKLQSEASSAAAEQPIWLIGERPDTAQDNGYHFFKYCREQYPDMPIYYVIAKDSPDRDNVRSLGHVLTFGSMEHFKKTAAASTFIGSHDLEYILPTRGVDWPSYQNGTRVFLQHGVLGRKKVDYGKDQYQYPFNVFCVSSESEQNMVVSQMDYQPDEVPVTGLARFDQLMEQPEAKPSILLMPTWRDWIKENSFQESAYFERYQSLLADSRLHALLEERDVQMDFYLHYRMQPYMAYFKELAASRLNIITFDEADVQTLLIRNQLLITDYSSVSFDFNYMKKPVLFYHFDFERFFKKGLLRPAEETFLGEICRDQDVLIEAIDRSITSGFQETTETRKQKGHLFKHIDQHNNERIMHAITTQAAKNETGQHPAT